MAQNNPILASEYNQIQSLISQVLGTGTGDYGYGQTVSSRQVQAKTNIKAEHWQKLRNDLLRARVHQTGDTALFDPDDQDNLVYPTNNIKLTDADRAAYLAMAQTCIADRLVTPPTGQATREKLIPDQVKDPGLGGWNGTIIQDITVTFNTANEARYFFNSGSRIEFSATLTGNTGTPGSKNNTWYSIFNSMGTIQFGRDYVNSTGSGDDTDKGWINLTTDPVYIFNSKTPIGNYADNKYIITARVNPDRTKIFFQILFRDDAAGGIDENVTGTLSSIVEVYRASGTNVSVPVPPASTTGLPGGAPVTPPEDPTDDVITVAPDRISVQEGEAVNYTVSTANIPNGRVMYWTTRTTPTEPGESPTTGADFTDGVTSGQFQITNNGATIVRVLVNDLLTEGPQTIRLDIRTGGTAGPIAASARTVTVQDTSIYVAPVVPPPPPPPPTPTYTVVPSSTVIDEGATIGFSVNTTNVTEGTVLYWTISGQADGTDFTQGSSGPMPISNNFGFQYINVISDSKTEGDETFIFNVRKDSITGDIVASTAMSIKIKDTSTTPSGNTVFRTPGSASFTVPANVSSINLEIVGGGGGGGGRDSHPGYNGYGGHKLTGTIAVVPGDVLQVGVGGGGKAGLDDSGGGAGGLGGANGDWSGGRGGASGPSGVSGSGGGGGGASYVITPTGKIIVAAGGGGGGGGGNYSDGQAQDLYISSGNTTGGPGGSKNSGWFNAPNDGAWGTFMRDYGIWTGGSQSVTTNTLAVNIYAPDDGAYTFIYSADNVLIWDLDGGTATTVSSNFATSSQKSVTLSKNTRHTLNISIQNTGGPAAVAFQIRKPNGDELWSTLAVASGNLGSDGGGGGGGGGGYLGGAGGYKVDGDSGGKSGADGSDFDSGLKFIKTQVNNGGQRGVRGSQAAGNGDDGFVAISWGG